MKIRTRAFLVLWLITILVAGTVGFIIYALNVASSQDADRQRLAETITIHGSLWRSLVELKHDQPMRPVSTCPPSRSACRPRVAPSTTTRAPGRAVQDPATWPLQQLRTLVDTGRRRGAAADRSQDAALLLAVSERDFAPITALLEDFDRRQREMRTNPSGPHTAPPGFFSIMTAIFASAMLLMMWLMFSTKRVVRPLTELTAAADR